MQASEYICGSRLLLEEVKSTFSQRKNPLVIDEAFNGFGNLIQDSHKLPIETKFEFMAQEASVNDKRLETVETKTLAKKTEKVNNPRPDKVHDEDWARCEDVRRSRTGYTFHIGKGCITVFTFFYTAKI
jgi:hypothetical protein